MAGALALVHPNRRPFSLVDPDISFPYVPKEKVSSGTLFAVSIVAPAVLITLISLIFVPGRNFSKQLSKSQLWRRKVWEWNAGWLGLALSLAVTTLLVDGLKILMGKPRPDLLARCDPDLPNAAAYILGGVNDRISEGTLVSWTICRQANKKLLEDGFQAFPSAHASFSFAGLFYFALYLCSKFAVRIPYLLPEAGGYAPSSGLRASASGHANGGSKSSEDIAPAKAPATPESIDSAASLRKQGAAPPLYTLVLPLIPICVALYISSTRYSDFKHHGFDIIVGASIGTVVAWLSFRLYHLPISQGAGWAWGSRSVSRAFGVGVGVLDYVEFEGRGERRGDLEAGA